MLIEPIAFLAFVALLFFGAAGWGAIAVAVLQRAGWEDARRDVDFPLQVILGVSLFVAVGGFLVAFGIARPAVLLAWHIIGLIVVANRYWARRPRATAVGPWTLIRAGLLCIISVVLFLISLSYAIGLPFFNPNDDDPSYVYLAQRLVSTGGLTDPFNLRRLASYGGSTLYQSLFLRLFGNSSLRGFEFTFCTLLLLVVTVRTTRRRWLLFGILVVGVGILVGHGIGPIINLSPTYSIAALSLGAYQLLTKIRPSSDEHPQPLVYVVIGVVLAAILAFRWSYLISVGFAVLVVIVILTGRKSWRGILLIGGTSLVCSAGWAVAAYRSSGTFLPIGGNLDPSYPGGNNPFLSFSAFASKVSFVFNANGSGQIAVLSILVALGYLLFTARYLDRMLVLLCAGLGCLLQLVFFTYVFSGSVVNDIERFIAPSALACGLFAIDTLWPIHQPDSGGVAHQASLREDLGHRLHRFTQGTSQIVTDTRFRPFISSAVTVLLLIGMVAVTFGNSPEPLVRTAYYGAKSGGRVLDGSTGFSDRYSRYRTEYHDLNALIPRGAKVLVAVERPALLDFSKFQFATLDIPGAASPPPHMPYFDGASAKVTYLRHLGFDFIVSDDATQPGLYNNWLEFLRSPTYYRRAYASYFADWQSTVTDLENSGHYQVKYVGSLALIDIR